MTKTFTCINCNLDSIVTGMPYQYRYKGEYREITVFDFTCPNCGTEQTALRRPEEVAHQEKVTRQAYKED